MGAVGNDEGHVEQAELRRDRRHDRRGQGDVDCAQKELLHHLAVIAELRRTVDDDLIVIAEPFVGEAREFIGRQVLQRTRVGADAEHDLFLCRGGHGGCGDGRA